MSGMSGLMSNGSSNGGNCMMSNGLGSLNSANFGNGSYAGSTGMDTNSCGSTMGIK